MRKRRDGSDGGRERRTPLLVVVTTIFFGDIITIEILFEKFEYEFEIRKKL